MDNTALRDLEEDMIMYEAGNCGINLYQVKLMLVFVLL